ncbi:MAG TPA: amidohydrolase family protein [Acidimicrobiales bacterium]|nr:amidohydrolase family protein [Acidimicrobiales bacterium]
MEELLMISGDTHLEIDSARWVHRVDSVHRARVPRVVRLPDGGDAWLTEGVPLREVPQDLYGGKGRANWTPFGQTYEATAGTGSPEQRLEEQLKDGIASEVIFPGVSGPGLWRNISDDDAYLAVVRGYNSYLAEEYCAVDPTRLFGVGVIPQTGIEDAVAELGRCKAAGLRAVLLSRFPNGSGVPKPEDDRFWAASLDLAMPVTVHGEISRAGASSILDYPNAKPGVVRRIHGSAQFAEQVTKMARGAGINAVQLVLSGVFDRFPDLEIFFAETQIGWIPLFLEVAEQRFDRHHLWAEELLGWQPLKHGRVSEYITRHCYWGFQRDLTGMALRHRMRVDRLIWGSDFPHQESDWPNSRDIVAANFAEVPDDEAALMCARNIARFLRLDGAT